MPVNPLRDRSAAQKRAIDAHTRGLQEMAKGVSQVSSQVGRSVNSVGPSISTGLQKQNINYQGMPQQTPSRVVASGVELSQHMGQKAAGALGATMPEYQGLPTQTPSQVAGRVTGMLPAPAPIQARPGLSAGARLQGILDGTVGSRATGGKPVAPAATPPRPARFGSGMQIPTPPGPFNLYPKSRPDFPQLGEQDMTRQGIQVPDMPPEISTYQPPVPYNVENDAERKYLESQGGLPKIRHIGEMGPALPPGYGAPEDPTVARMREERNKQVASYLNGSPPPAPSSGGIQPRNPLADPSARGPMPGLKTPNPAFYRDVPGAPPAAPPPAGYAPLPGTPTAGGQPPLLPPPGGRFDPNSSPEAAAINERFPPIQPPVVRAPVSPNIGGVGLAPQSQAVEANIIRDQQIARQGNFRESALAGMNDRSPEASPLGGYASNQGSFDARMKAENPLRAYSGTLPVRGADGRVTFADGPMKDFNMGKPFSAQGDKYVKNEQGQMVRGPGFSDSDRAASNAAKATFDARRGGLVQRQQDYQQRTASNRNMRQEGVANRAAIRAEARSLRRGNLTFDERLAMKDPRAAAQREVGQAGIAAANSRERATDTYRRDVLKSQEQRDKDRNETNLRISENRIAAEAAANDTPNPLKPADKPRDYSKDDYRAMSPGDAVEDMKGRGMTPSEINNQMNEIRGTQNHNYFLHPEGPSRWGGSGQTIPAPPTPPATAAPPPVSAAPAPGQAPYRSPREIAAERGRQNPLKPAEPAPKKPSNPRAYNSPPRVERSNRGRP